MELVLFIELTNACKRSMPRNGKFSLNKNQILYFSEYLGLVDNSNYEFCNSVVETLGGAEGSQLYYVKETYDQIKELLKNAN